MEKIQTMKNVIMYVCLSKYSSEQSDLIHRVKQEKGLDEIPQYKAVLNKFTTNEIISAAGFCQLFEQELRDGAAGKATEVFR